MPVNALAGYFRADTDELGDRPLAAFLALGGFLSLAALVGITIDVGWHGLEQALLHADWVFVLIVPVAVAVSHLGYTIAYREVAGLERGDDLSLREAFELVMTGFGPLSPRGGFAFDIDQLVRRGASHQAAEHRVRVLGMLEYAVLAPVTLLAAIYMMAQGMKAQPGLVPSWVIGVPVGAAVALGLLVKWRQDGRPKSWWSPVHDGLEAIDGLLDLLRSWSKAPVALFGMALYWAAEITALGGCIDVFAHRRGAVAVMIVGYATGYALTRRSLPLAGAGIVEALMPFALNWVGFPLASAILAVIAYRVFNMWLPMIPAVVSIRRLDGPGGYPRASAPAERRPVVSRR
jgi:hypothetical protein